MCLCSSRLALVFLDGSLDSPLHRENCICVCICIRAFTLICIWIRIWYISKLTTLYWENYMWAQKYILNISYWKCPLFILHFYISLLTYLHTSIYFPHTVSHRLQVQICEKCAAICEFAHLLCILSFCVSLPYYFIWICTGTGPLTQRELFLWLYKTWLMGVSRYRNILCQPAVSIAAKKSICLYLCDIFVHIINHIIIFVLYNWYFTSISIPWHNTNVHIGHTHAWHLWIHVITKQCNVTFHFVWGSVCSRL